MSAFLLVISNKQKTQTLELFHVVLNRTLSTTEYSRQLTLSFD